MADAAPSATRTPADFLKGIKGRPVIVKLNSGVEYRGARSLLRTVVALWRCAPLPPAGRCLAGKLAWRASCQRVVCAAAARAGLAACNANSRGRPRVACVRTLSRACVGADAACAGAGTLACLDGYMNIAMEQTEARLRRRTHTARAQRRCNPRVHVAFTRASLTHLHLHPRAQEYSNGVLKNKYGDAFIRGNNGTTHWPRTHAQHTPARVLALLCSLCAADACWRALPPRSCALRSAVHQHGARHVSGWQRAAEGRAATAKRERRGRDAAAPAREPNLSARARTGRGARGVAAAPSLRACGAAADGSLTRRARGSGDGAATLAGAARAAAGTNNRVLPGGETQQQQQQRNKHARRW
jgi:small nuclear ribonucleoprotein (snRNP)-like protein